MNRPVTFWYTKDQPIFENTDDMADTRIDVARIPAGSDTPPCLKISHNTFETMEKANWEFLRLSLPIICQSEFVTEGEKVRRWQEIKMRQNRLFHDQVESHAQPSAHIEQIMRSGFSMSDIKGMTGTWSMCLFINLLSFWFCFIAPSVELVVKAVTGNDYTHILQSYIFIYCKTTIFSLMIDTHNFLFPTHTHKDTIHKILNSNTSELNKTIRKPL